MRRIPRCCVVASRVCCQPLRQNNIPDPSRLVLRTPLRAFSATRYVYPDYTCFYAGDIKWKIFIMGIIYRDLWGNQVVSASVSAGSTRFKRWLQIKLSMGSTATTCPCISHEFPVQGRGNPRNLTWQFFMAADSMMWYSNQFAGRGLLRVIKSFKSLNIEKWQWYYKLNLWIRCVYIL